MSPILALSILLCFVTFHVGITNSLHDTVTVEEKAADLNQTITPTKLVPEPTQQPVTKDTSPTTKPTVPTTNPTSPSTSTTTPAPPTTTPQPPTTTKSSTTSGPTTTPPTPTPGPTNGTSTASPSTTTAPPTPSDRKFDAFSFLGGFALGLGLVAIGFLSWKFYLSRQENYYHTL